MRGALIPDEISDHIRRSLTKEQTWFAPSGLRIQYRITWRGWLRMKWSILRERIGFWIAGYTPEDDY